MKVIPFFFACLFGAAAFAQHSFKIIPLGVKGGGDESDLSSYMLAVAGTENYVCLDAGTIRAGLKLSVETHALQGSVEALLRNNIKGYLISHGHLDHVAGLILNSPDDSMKNIYCMPYVKDIFKEKYFTAGPWSNFSDEGEVPLNKYHYVVLDTAKEVPLAHTNMFVTAFPLSHGNPYKSTAFLVRHNEDHILYLGDTGPDDIEHSDDLMAVWKDIAPLIKTKKLKAIFIECSFPDEQPDDKLFGHLNPRWLMMELDRLTLITGDRALKNFPVVITHIKPGGNHEQQIKKQLAAENHLGIKLIYAEQGKALLF